MVTPAAHRSDIELGLLGPLRATVRGGEVAVGGPRQTAVLARLMVTPNQVVSMEQLIDGVWDGDEPKRPHVAIRSYVSNLRRAMEPNRRRRAADSCLASAPPGYRLSIDPEAVDWLRFQRLVDEARSQLADGRHGAAVGHLRHALSLWRGEPCAGLPTSEVFEAHRVRLTGLHQTASELLFDSLLGQGEHDLVAAEIEAAIVADPLRERLTELGMLAFYRSGRQSEALALGRRLRDHLLEELGIDPSPSIAEMELRILNHDPDLDVGPEPPTLDAARSTASTATPAAAGPRLLEPWPSTGPGGPDGGLPAPVGSTALVGRREVQERLWSAMAPVLEGRVAGAAIVGEQGIGKTALAMELVEGLAEQGAAVVCGRGVADGGGPLWPWAQIVLGLLERFGADEASRVQLIDGLEALGGLGPTVAAALPKRAAVHHAPTSEIMLAVTRLLERCGRRSPLVVVLEDLHWADRPTVTQLEFALTTLDGVPVGLVATWTGSAIDRAVERSLRGLARLSVMERIDLRPLDHTAVVDLAEALGRPVSPAEAQAIDRRAAGHPFYARELILQPGDRAGGPVPPALRDAVLARVERLHELAMPVLRAAALIRGSFTIEDLEPLRPPTVTSIDRVVAAAVEAGVLEEDDPRLATHRFRHGLVQEVLAGVVSATELRTSHRIIGLHLLASDEVEAAHHLAWSPEAADRALSAQIALDLFHRSPQTTPLAELDRRVRNGLGAAESLRRTPQGRSWDRLVTDALGFLSWRARAEDRPDDWYDNGCRNLRAAIEGLGGDGPSQPSASSGLPARSSSGPGTPLRGAGRGPVTDRPIERLERAVLNLIGLPVVPAGPGDPQAYAALSGPLVPELADAVERLPAENPVRLAARVHLLAVGPAAGGGRPARAKAMREAGRLVSAAKRRLDGPALAPVLATYAARFADQLDPSEVESVLDAHRACCPGVAADLLWARYGYPLLVAAGRAERGARVVETALSSAEAEGDALRRAEARLLWNRHLLWVGEIAAAERSIDELGAELAALGLPEPAPVLRQRRALRSRRGQPGDPRPSDRADGARPLMMLGADRASPAELAFRLAQIGQLERAAAEIEQLADPSLIADADVVDLALLGAAAGKVGNCEAAELALDRLGSRERLIVHRDGSTILGPPELWAAAAARGAGREAEVGPLVARALEEVGRQGGGPQLVAGLGLDLPLTG